MINNHNVINHLARNRLKDSLRHNALARIIYHKIRSIRNKDYFCRKSQVINEGIGSIRKIIEGSNHKIIIGKNTVLNSPVFHIRGHNNTITIGDNCTIGKGCSFWMEGNDINIIIGKGTTFTQFVHFNAQEDNSKIEVGEDCMFSNHIIVRTSDSHPIYSLETGKRINPAKNIIIGSNVWIAPDTKIMKGAEIGNNSIIGSNSMVSKQIPGNCLAVGMPAKVVKENVRWTREDIIFENKKH